MHADRSPELRGARSASSSRLAVYPSAVDGWIVVVMGATLAVVGYGVWSAWSASALGNGLLVLSFLAVVATIPGLMWPCVYTLADDALIVRAGLRIVRVPYVDIRSIESAHSLASGMSLSLNRLAVRVGYEEILVSPRDLAGFRAALQQRVAAAGAAPAPHSG
jgi:hypothetical protein